MKTGQNVNRFQEKTLPERIAENRYHAAELEARYVDTFRVSDCSEDNMRLHSHSFYEIVYCRSSGGVEYLVGAERYRLQRGDIVLIPPDVSHRPILPEQMPEPYVRDLLRVSPELMTEIGKAGTEPKSYPAVQARLLRTAGTRWEFLDQMFRRGITETELRAPGWEYAVLGSTIQLLVNLHRAIVDSSTSALKAEKPELLDRVLLYVERNLASRITLADIAHHFFVSESTISQTFRNKMGVSFYRCVTQQRLIAAKHLIAEGVAMESVGRQVGFSDYSTFYRAFRQEFGMAPRQYRKLLEEAAERGELHE